MYLKTIFVSQFSNMRQIFKDPLIESQFQEQGFYRFQLLDENELAEARRIFEENDPQLESNFYASINSKDFDYRRAVHDQLKLLLNEKLLAYFIDYRSIAYTFICKRPKAEDTIIHPHADDTHILEEDVMETVNVFCPLIDTVEANGALSVLPGSHKLPYSWRGFGMPFDYEPYWNLYRKHGVRSDLRAGEALFYHDRIIHWSGPNLTDEIRPVIVTGFMPSEATPVICYQHGDPSNHKVELFKVDDDFWFTFDPNTKPDAANSLGIKEHIPVTMSDSEFMDRMDIKTQGVLSKLMQRIFRD